MVHCSPFNWARRAFLGMLLSVSTNLSADAQVSPLTAQDPLPRPTTLFARATEIDVRLIEALNAATAQENDRLEVVTVRPVVTDRGVEIPAGSILTGTISGVRSPTETNVGFNRFIVNGELYFVTGGVIQVMDSRGSAIAGVKASSFGDLTSTRGRLELPRGTIFRVRLR
jgi:hypothetical protein